MTVRDLRGSTSEPEEAPVAILTQEALETQKKKRPTTTLLTRLPDPELTVQQREKREQLFALAEELGFVCQSCEGLRRDFFQQVYARMTNRLGRSIHQVVCISMSFPVQACRPHATRMLTSFSVGPKCSTFCARIV